jgi:PBP1b-binding outer membrane lipoprotein LpoB
MKKVILVSALALALFMVACAKKQQNAETPIAATEEVTEEATALDTITEDVVETESVESTETAAE